MDARGFSLLHRALNLSAGNHFYNYFPIIFECSLDRFLKIIFGFDLEILQKSLGWLV